MALIVREEDLERRADDTYRDRRIPASTYCGRCGYNLKTQVYVGRCPECGNAYNARPLILTGIFNIHDIPLPFGSYLLGLMCAASAAVLAWTAWNPIDWTRVTLAAGFVLFAIWHLYKGVARTAYCFRAMGIWRRIREEEYGE